MVLRCMLFMARTAGMISPMFLSSPPVAATGQKCTPRQPEKRKSSSAFIGMSADILIVNSLGCKTKHLHIYCFQCRICLLVFMAPLPYPSVWMKGLWLIVGNSVCLYNDYMMHFCARLDSAHNIRVRGSILLEFQQPQYEKKMVQSKNN